MALGNLQCPGPEVVASPCGAPKSYLMGEQQKCLFEPSSTPMAKVVVGSELKPTSSCTGGVIALVISGVRGEQ